MSLDDLDLEFEDEEVEKKSDAVSVDLDLEFGTDTNIAITRPLPGASSKPAPKPTITPKSPPQVVKPQAQSNGTNPGIVAKTASDSNVRPIIAKAQATTAPQVNPEIQTPVMGSSALKVEPLIEVNASTGEQQLIAELQSKIEKMETDAQIKVAVAEFKTDILSDLLSDIKLLEHQVGGLLNRIHAKHPDLKQEALMIKKLLADFSQKKRK